MKNKIQQLGSGIKNIQKKICAINIYIKILFIIIIFYFILFFQVEKIERNMTFPLSQIESQKNVETSLDIEEINVQMSNGVINGIYLGNGEGKTVYYFHGNGGTLPEFYSDIEYIHSLGYNVMSYDYPGYGKSTGIPKQKTIAQYSQIFYKDLQSKKQIKDEDIIIWGSSIGTAAAADFAGRNSFDKLIFVSPIASRYDMSKSMFGFAVQKIFFRKNTFNTKDAVKYFSQPALIIHGNTDNVIPFSQGQSVYQEFGIENNTGNQKYLIELDNFGHNGIIETYGLALEGKILEFLESGKIQSETSIFKITQKNKHIWEDESKKYKNIFSADLETDDSITKFVNSSVPFNNKAYVPENLASFASEYVGDGKGYGQLREEVIPHLESLGKAFYQEFGRKFLINSSYRSYAYQKNIKAGGCPDNLCAKAGYSEHQSGLGFDIFSISNQSTWKNNATLSAYYAWLDKNAHMYGFTNTYQKGLKIDGYEIEPWHWRYVGVDLATHLSENKKTIAEFYYSQKNNDE